MSCELWRGPEQTFAPGARVGPILWVRAAAIPSVIFSSNASRHSIVRGAAKREVVCIAGHGKKIELGKEERNGKEGFWLW